MKHCIWAFLLIGLPVMVSATQIPLRSGQHKDFARIVLQVPEGKSWQAKKIGNSVSITIPGHSSGYKIDEVFQRIPKTHISKVEAQDSTFRLHFDCDCDVVAFDVENNFLAIDIAEKGTRPPEKALIDQNLESSPPSIQNQLWFNETAIKTQYHPVNDSLKSPIPRPLGTQNDLSRELSKRIGMAAMQGILSSIPKEDGAAFSNLSRSIILEKSTETTLKQIERLPHGSNQLQISSSVQSPSTHRADGHGNDFRESTCPDNDSIAVHHWGRPNQYSEQISSLRKKLFTEFDEIDIEVARQIIRTYLYFGFGVEATAIFDIAPQLKKSDPIAYEISIGIGGIGDAQGGQLDQYINCDGDISLWALISNRQAEELRMNSAAALLALNKIPLHLRRFLVPEIGRKLATVGDFQGAARALRSLDRDIFPESTPVIMAHAVLAVQRQEVQAARENFKIVAGKNSPDSPIAIVHLFEEESLRYEGISLSNLPLLESYLGEYQGTETGASIREAYIIGLANSQNFEKAFTSLEDQYPHNNAQARKSLFGKLIEIVTKRAGNVTFLEYFFAYEGEIISVQQSSTKLNIAGRLVELGLPRAANTVLASFSQSIPDIQVNILEAKVALALGQPYKAQAKLSAHDGDIVHLLRGKAKEQLGAYDQAFTLFSEIGEFEAKESAAWLSREWRTIEPSNNFFFKHIADLNQPILPIGRTEGPNMESILTTVNESEVARRAIYDLLRLGETGFP